MAKIYTRMKWVIFIYIALGSNKNGLINDVLFINDIVIIYYQYQSWMILAALFCSAMVKSRLLKMIVFWRWKVVSELNVQELTSEINYVGNLVTLKIWHHRLCHLGETAMNNLCSKDYVDSFKFNKEKVRDLCNVCVTTK